MVKQEIAAIRGARVNKTEMQETLDDFIQSRPKDVDLTDEEIMEEVRAVRYK